MKKVIIGLIKLYQKLPLHSHSMCRYKPTCSNYMIDAIEYYGTFKGILLGIKRILRCNRFHKGGYDPIYKEEL